MSSRPSPFRASKSPTLSGAFLVGFLLLGCGDEEICGDDAQAALDAASPGETVFLGACRVTGPLIMPAGVSLAGAGAGITIVQAIGDEPTIRITGGTVPVSLRSLSVESSGCAGLIAGTSPLTIGAVSVRASRGIGVGVAGATSLDVVNLDIDGPLEAAILTTEMPSLPPYRCSPVASHGLVILDTPDAALANVNIKGFSAFGALALRSSVTWEAGSVTSGLGAGINVWGGTAALNDVRVEDIRQGIGAVEVFGAFFGGDAAVTSSNLRVADADGIGLMHDNATSHHVGLEVVDTGFAGIWAQSSAGLRVESSMIDGARFAGFVVRESSDIDVDGLMIANTTEGSSLVGATGSVRAADGLQLIESTGTARNVMLENNGRTGLLLELAGAASTTVSLADISISGSGTQLGAIAQNGTIAAGWDDGITRVPALAANDAAFTSVLDIAGAIGPACLPAPTEAMATGLDSFLP